MIEKNGPGCKAKEVLTLKNEHKAKLSDSADEDVIVDLEDIVDDEFSDSEKETLEIVDTIDEDIDEQNEDDEFFDNKLAKSSDEIKKDEAFSVAPEHVERVIESVVKQIVSEKMEFVLEKAIEKAVAQEIERIKGLLLENS